MVLVRLHTPTNTPSPLSLPPSLQAHAHSHSSGHHCVWTGVHHFPGGDASGHHVEHEEVSPTHTAPLRPSMWHEAVAFSAIAFNVAWPSHRQFTIACVQGCHRSCNLFLADWDHSHAIRTIHQAPSRCVCVCVCLRYPNSCSVVWRLVLSVMILYVLTLIFALFQVTPSLPPSLPFLIPPFIPPSLPPFLS